MRIGPKSQLAVVDGLVDDVHVSHQQPPPTPGLPAPDTLADLNLCLGDGTVQWWEPAAEAHGPVGPRDRVELFAVALPLGAVHQVLRDLARRDAACWEARTMTWKAEPSSIR